ncbi:hypothetical protein E1B28_005154 [Marasmius oreades]|uniref:Uncharacterized protein n=1 Tax=Marasmius oreades TaxID=181124 RepID=A0A9P7V012_9AGAR|nr:uncharacterized protein E1B28_005154 [Marasmius oreades]KAG7097836.1 hypothetical protein E1B28_005154 [Marasmius oreades]
MSFFQEACGVSIGQGTFNAVTGNQTNHIYNGMVQQKKHTIYDEFYEIKLGGVHRIRDIHCENYPRRWDIGIREWYEERRLRVDRTICAAEIRGEQGSRFTVVSYSGPEKDKAWKEDFQLVSKATNTTKMQLFGINRSSVPLLIFYGELVPLAHVWDRVGLLGQSYANTLSYDVLDCAAPSEMWIDPAQGTLIRGVEGPNRYLYHPNLSESSVETLPPLLSSVELLLDEDVCFRYLSRFPFDKEFDRRVIEVLYFTSENGWRSRIVHHEKPYVLSSTTNSIIAVGSGSHVYWTGFSGFECLEDQVLMPDGRTRFTLINEATNLILCSDILGDKRVWLSQASSIFDRLGISLNDDLSSYKLILPDIELRGSIEGSQRRSEDQPIYLFLHQLHSISPPLEVGSVVSIHTWSHDKNGQIAIPRHHYKDLGLPTELSVKEFTSYPCSWPSETYKSIHKWQIARGFDPTTIDFTRYLRYPIYEVQQESGSARFEEVPV